jgi:TldD protein
MPHQIDPEFTALPLQAVADAALERAQQLGVEHADVRIERIRTADLALHNARLETSHDNDERGLAVRVVHEGTWGFAAGLVVEPDAARVLVDRAIEVATVSKPVTGERIELAAEPSHGEQTWVSSYEVDPFTINESDRIELLADWSSRLLGAEIVRHVDAHLKQVRETKFYADLGGTRTTPRPGSTTPPAASRRCGRSRRPSGAAGSSSPAAATTGELSSPGYRNGLPRRPSHRRSSPAAMT